MKSLLREMEEKFTEIDNYCKQCDKSMDEGCNCDEIEEHNVTGAVAGYSTPNAFRKTTKKVGYATGMDESIHKLKSEDILENQYLKLIEGYRQFATNDPKISPEKKVNNTIKEIAKKLQEIETLVQYNSKLKTESGLSSSEYGKQTQKALTKISERLIKISERVRSLGE